MAERMRYSGQILAYALFGAFVAYFSTTPAYGPIQAGEARMTLSFAHKAQPKGPCRKRTEEELARLPPNMRAPLVCPRERAPVSVRMTVDGKVLYEETLPPTGLSRDGAVYVYQRFDVPAGEHRIALRLRDQPGTDGFDYRLDKVVDVQPAQMLVIDFDPAHGGFWFP